MFREIAALAPAPSPSTLEHPTTTPAADSALSPAVALGRFGDYELIEEIARGGMGVVFKAQQVSLSRMVALKFILANPFATKPFIQRFRAEAGAAAALQHPNIVAIHEIGMHAGQHFFSMDYVDGPNLWRNWRQVVLYRRMRPHGLFETLPALFSTPTSRAFCTGTSNHPTS